MGTNLVIEMDPWRGGFRLQKFQTNTRNSSAKPIAIKLFSNTIIAYYDLRLRGITSIESIFADRGGIPLVGVEKSAIQDGEFVMEEASLQLGFLTVTQTTEVIRLDWGKKNEQDCIVEEQKQLQIRVWFSQQKKKIRSTYVPFLSGLEIAWEKLAWEYPILSVWIFTTDFKN